VTSIAIYIEGGGDSTSGKAQLRQGFDALLAPQKDAARARKIRWKLVLCGGRNATYDAFQHATKTPGSEIVVLLVDAEEPVTTSTPEGRVAHLAKRDQWNLEGVAAEHVHLMTQCMEAWIVADAETLAAFYGKDFHRGALPKRNVLDDEPKASLYAALEAATKHTQKGSYGKIKHASELLKRVRPAIVAPRCTSFQDFTKGLDAAIAGT
jgi:uncharacterized protein DUF4276